MFVFSLTVRDDTLLDMVQHMGEKTGLVHQMPFTCDRDGFAATFEKVFHELLCCVIEILFNEFYSNYIFVFFYSV